MIGAVVQRGLNAGNRIAGQHAVLHTFFEALFNRRNKVARYGPADDLVDKTEIVVRVRHWIKFDKDVTVLAAAAGLFLVFAFGVRALLDGFAVRHLHRRELDVDVEFLFQFIGNDFQLHFADAGNDGLFRFLVAGHRDGRIFFDQAVQPGGELIDAALVLCVDRHRNHRFREIDRRVDDRVGRIAEGIASLDVSELAESADVAGDQAVDFDLFVAPQHVNVVGLCLHILIGVDDFGVAVQRPAHDLKDRELADERVDDGFEDTG